MRDEVVFELAGFEQFGLDDVVEAQLTHGDEDGSGGSPIGAGKQLSDSFLATHANQAVNRVLVTEQDQQQ